MTRMAGTGSARVFSLLATIVRVVCSVIAALIVIHAVFVLFDANPDNLLVTVHGRLAGHLRLVHQGPLHAAGPKIAEAINDGLAALIWVVVGNLLSKLIVRLTPTPSSKAKA